MNAQERCGECFGTGTEVPGNPEDASPCWQCEGTGRRSAVTGEVTRDVLEAGYTAGLISFAQILKRRVQADPSATSWETIILAMTEAEGAAPVVCQQVWRALVEEMHESLDDVEKS